MKDTIANSCRRTPGLARRWAVCLICVTSGCSGVIPGQATTNGTDPDSKDASASALVVSPRGGAPAVWLTAARKMILFGGMQPITGDTFEYDADDDQWRQLRPEDTGPVPAARCHHTLVSDGSDQNIFLFGGFSFGGRFNDLWQYDAADTRWILLQPAGTPPAARCLHTAAYITSRNEMIVYGGISGAGISADDFFADTHIYDITNDEWINLVASGPGKLAGAIAFYSSADDAVYLWGGKQVDGYPKTLWRFDVNQREWQAVRVGGATPTGREDPTYFWDDVRGVLIITTGRNDSTPEVLLDDAYELDLPALRWRRLNLNGSPAQRWRASVVFDEQTRTGLMFGGWRDSGGVDAFNDTWRFGENAMEWTQVALAGP